MNKVQADAILEAAETEGLEVNIRDDYSGRFMFGERTWAVTGHPNDVEDAIAHAGLRPSQFRRDQMGLGIVVY